jgi:uncharacterized membrane protein
MPETKTSTIPILVEPPSVFRLYIRLALLTLIFGVSAVIAGVVGALLKDYLTVLYRQWIYYLE